MLFLNLLCIAFLIVIIICIRTHLSLRKAKQKAKQQHEATKVVFFRDDCDLSWEWSENPHIGAN